MDKTKEDERILIAEDDLTSRMVMEGFIKKLGFEPVLATNGLEAWNILSGDDSPCLALIDWEMPEMDGLEVVRKVRETFKEHCAYLIMVTGKSEKEEIIHGIEQGADDYVVKPFDKKELDVRIRAGMRIVRLQKKLMKASRQMEALAKTDSLTGFYNRLALRNDLMKHLTDVTINDYSVSFIMADIDHFKKVNDTYGHDAGDEVLKQFSDRVRSLLRHGDIVYRMGGEEFLLIAPETDESAGAMVAERVRNTIQSNPFVLQDGKELNVTCSLGVYTTVIEGSVQNFETQIKNADQALYLSKANGRNQVTVFNNQTTS